MTTEMDSVDAKRVDQVTSVAEDGNDNVQIVHPRIERFQCLVRINHLILIRTKQCFFHEK